MKVSLQDKAGKQSLEIPAAFRIDDQEVYLKKLGDSLVLIPASNPWQSLFDSLLLFSDDFFSNLQQPDIQPRNFFPTL